MMLNQDGEMDIISFAFPFLTSTQTKLKSPINHG